MFYSHSMVLKSQVARTGLLNSSISGAVAQNVTRKYLGTSNLPTVSLHKAVSVGPVGGPLSAGQVNKFSSVNSRGTKKGSSFSRNKGRGPKKGGGSFVKFGDALKLKEAADRAALKLRKQEAHWADESRRSVLLAESFISSASALESVEIFKEVDAEIASEVNKSSDQSFNSRRSLAKEASSIVSLPQPGVDYFSDTFGGGSSPKQSSDWDFRGHCIGIAYVGPVWLKSSESKSSLEHQSHTVELTIDTGEIVQWVLDTNTLMDAVGDSVAASLGLSRPLPVKELNQEKEVGLSHEGAETSRLTGLESSWASRATLLGKDSSLRVRESGKEESEDSFKVVRSLACSTTGDEDLSSGDIRQVDDHRLYSRVYKSMGSSEVDILMGLKESNTDSILSGSRYTSNQEDGWVYPLKLRLGIWRQVRVSASGSGGVRSKASRSLSFYKGDFLHNLAVLGTKVELSNLSLDAVKGMEAESIGAEAKSYLGDLVPLLSGKLSITHQVGLLLKAIETLSARDTSSKKQIEGRKTSLSWFDQEGRQEEGASAPS